MRRSPVFGIAALLATATALPVVAQEVQPRQRVVLYSDLNLDNPRGAHTMVRRSKMHRAKCAVTVRDRAALRRTAARTRVPR